MISTTLNDNIQAQRFELVEDGKVVGIVEYRISGNTVTMTHTVVPDKYKGKRYGPNWPGWPSTISGKNK